MSEGPADTRKPVIRIAVETDVMAVVDMMAIFYAEDGMPFSADSAREAVARLIGDKSLGRLWIAEFMGESVGYVALTFGYSLEFMGRDAFVDDLFVKAECRGMGIGGRLLEVLTDACPQFRVRAVHLEVDRAKTHARNLYRRFGFVDHDRLLMTHRIESGPESWE